MALLTTLVGSLAGNAAYAADFRVPQDGDLSQAIASIQTGGIIEISGGNYTAPVDGWQLGNLGKSFTVQGASGATTVLSGASARPIVRIENASLASGATIFFKNLTFRRGRSTLYQLAGGVTLGKARAVFDDCVFDQNTSDTTNTGGGGLLLWGGASATVRDSLFLDNTAATEGGAVVLYDSEITVERSQFVGNRVNLPGHRNTSAGGAIAAMSSDATIVRSRFEANQAGFAAGAVYGYGPWSGGSAPNAHITIDNSTFDSNFTQPSVGIQPPEPLQGGAVHVEDQARVDITRSRFFSNYAEGGGAVNAYRATISIEDSVFRGNRATGLGPGTGYGGAIGLLSGDTPADGWTNRPSGSLTVRRTFIQCGWGGVTVAAQSGGAIFASGDRNRSYGNGIPKLGTPASNAARVILDRVALVDCRTQGTGIPGEGGGFELSQVNADITDTIVVGSRATGTDANGGGGRIVFESDVRIARSTFALNDATHFGGGLAVMGATVDVSDSAFVLNEVSPGVNEASGQSFGAAFYAGPIPDFLGYQMDAVGIVRSSDFAANGGLAIFDDDRADGPINDIRYDGNRFDEASFGSAVYQDPIAGVPLDVAGLNALIVRRTGGEPSTDKSQSANADQGLVTGAILAVPPMVLAEVAEGDPEPAGESFLVYTWSGASARLDGGSVSGNSGVRSATPGNHSLTVGGQTFEASVDQATPALLVSGFESGGMDGWSLVIQ